jgi:hypothetical protein
MREIGQYVHFEMFKSTFSSWESLFMEAAKFAENVGPEHLIGISHSSDHSEGVVTVWYWSNRPRGTSQP